MKIIKYDNKQDCEHLLGTFLDESHYDTLIQEDCDFYDITGDLSETSSEKNIIFKFRKNLFTPEEVMGAYEGLLECTTMSTNNRGKATGPRGKTNGGRYWVTDHQLSVLKKIAYPGLEKYSIDEIIEMTPHSNEDSKDRGNVWVRNKCESIGIKNYDNHWEEMIESLKSLNDEDSMSSKAKEFLSCVSSTTYANVVFSSVIGAFDRFPRFPFGRLCAYNLENEQRFSSAYPFFRKLDQTFQKLLPQRYSKQWECAARIDEKFRVALDTVFTTITINKNFRTAAHRDAGDLNEGFSNLCVIAKEKDWQGGYLVLPEFRVAIDLRPGDLLLINNHEGIHGNTEIIPPEGKDIEDMERISVVSYFREKMLECGTYEYETLRKDFVESRRNDQNHPDWFKGWNGVTPNMFNSDEWKEFLSKHPKGDEFIYKYHKEFIKEESLEDLFG